jgi:hypothetical protein
MLRDEFYSCKTKVIAAECKTAPASFNDIIKTCDNDKNSNNYSRNINTNSIGRTRGKSAVCPKMTDFLLQASSCACIHKIQDQWNSKCKKELLKVFN